MPGGRTIVMTSDKGTEVSIINTDGKLTVYDSSSGNVITLSVDCYGACMGACGGVIGYACSDGCPTICTALVETGLGYIACLVACLAVCGVGTILGCDAICGFIC